MGKPNSSVVACVADCEESLLSTEAVRFSRDSERRSASSFAILLLLLLLLLLLDDDCRLMRGTCGL